MKLAKFWSRDSVDVDGVSTSARGWSDESFDQARAKAREIARRLATRILNNEPKERYPYGDRPIPEPLIRTLDGAVVTRNAYGTLVLNADSMMFVDLDNESRRPPSRQQVESVAAKHALSGRLYQTAAGFRVILTNRKFDPTSAESEALLREFGSDPMYVRLCKMQASYRARLTPKPWRCEWYKPPGKFPYEDTHAQQRFDSWLREYDRQSAAYATCQLVSTFGAAEPLAEFSALIGYHDGETKAASGQPLA